MIQALLNIEIEESCCELTTKQIEDLINGGDDSIEFDFENNDVIQYDAFNNTKLLGKFHLVLTPLTQPQNRCVSYLNS